MDSKDYIDLPNGFRLYWKENEVGGRTYISDEIGGVVGVWNTALVDSSTILAALTQECALQYQEIHKSTMHQCIQIP